VGKICAICISKKKGTVKHAIDSGEFIIGFGIKGDAHAGESIRQVSLLSLEKINEFRAKGVSVENGAFGENLVVQGINFSALPLGTILHSANVILEITQIGKKCHNHCAIYEQTGDCIMPREGAFAKVVRGGFIKTGDEMFAEVQYRAAIITVSDRCSRNERTDESGALVKKIIETAGYKVTRSIILPDEQNILEKEMSRICDEGTADLLLTTGGTGFSCRDRTPEASLAIAERLVPGIAEVMRNKSMAITGRAMLNRSVSVIRNKTLIINLPGSPKAAKENLEFIIGELKHGLDILCGYSSECAV
jgi:molybdenum cofactor synthesis domain-containing protein